VHAEPVLGFMHRVNVTGWCGTDELQTPRPVRDHRRSGQCPRQPGGIRVRVGVESTNCPRSRVRVGRDARQVPVTVEETHQRL